MVNPAAHNPGRSTGTKRSAVDPKNMQEGNNKRAGKTPGQRSNWKKAYVRLAKGQDIDFLGHA